MNLTWIRTWEDGADYIESIGGIAWSDGEPPYPWHLCFPQTRGFIGLRFTERCRCGAARLDGGGWVSRNETRKARRKERAEARLPRVQVTCGSCGQPYEAADGTAIARERLCTDCWSKQFIRLYGR